MLGAVGTVCSGGSCQSGKNLNCITDPSGQMTCTHGNDGLSAGDVTGLVIGLIVLLCLIGVGVYFCVRARNKTELPAQDLPPPKTAAQAFDGVTGQSPQAVDTV